MTPRKKPPAAIAPRPGSVTKGWWEVYPAYEITKPSWIVDDFEGLVLKPAGHWTEWKKPRVQKYFPTDQLGLLSAVQKLQGGDEKLIIQFAEEYGGLGYWSAAIHSPGLEHREAIIHFNDRQDPVGWIKMHARWIALLSHAAEIITGGASRNREQDAYVLLKGLVEKAWPPPSARKGLVSLAVPVGPAIETFKFVFRPKGHALPELERLFKQLVYRNLKGVERIPQIAKSGKITSWFYFPSLIAAVYWQLQEAAEKRALRRCEACHSLFFSTDKRQRFCPSVSGKKSRCGARLRKRESRERLESKRSKR